MNMLLTKTLRRSFVWSLLIRIHLHQITQKKFRVTPSDSYTSSPNHSKGVSCNAIGLGYILTKPLRRSVMWITPGASRGSDIPQNPLALKGRDCLGNTPHQSRSCQVSRPCRANRAELSLTPGWRRGLFTSGILRIQLFNCAFSAGIHVIYSVILCSVWGRNMYPQ